MSNRMIEDFVLSNLNSKLNDMEANLDKLLVNLKGNSDYLLALQFQRLIHGEYGFNLPDPVRSLNPTFQAFKPLAQQMVKNGWLQEDRLRAFDDRRDNSGD